MPRRNQTQTQEPTTENSRETLHFEAVMKDQYPRKGVLATADVTVGDFMTVRNVKIKEDDYGLTVTMPQTKMPHSDEFKDTVFFAEKEMREQFDQVVVKAYQDMVQTQSHTLEDMDEDMDEQHEGMQQTMGM